MSFSFDGVDDYLSAQPGNLGALMTAFIAMNPSAYGENNRAHLFTQGTGADAAGPRVNFQFGDGVGGVYLNTLHLVTDRATTPGRWTIPYDPTQLGKWQSAAFSIDASSTANDPTMYVNGQPGVVTRRTTPSGALVADGGTCYFGNSSGLTRTFLGQITTIAMWKRILTPSEHALVHYCGVRKVLRGLWFWYRFTNANGWSAEWSGSTVALAGTGMVFVPGAEGDRLATAA